MSGILRLRRWRAAWLAVAVVAGLLAAYTLAGFWLVPRLIEHQVPKLGQSELARQATIGAVSFNPYTLRLEARDLSLAEADGAPLFAIGKLAVELQWRSLFRRVWSFAEIRITAPSANLVIAPDGKFNLAELLSKFGRRPQPSATGATLPRLTIERLVLEQGRLELRDHRADYADSFFPIDFALNNFSTLPDQNGSYTFSADSAHGGKLRWKGEASLNPIRGSGELSLEHISLPELSAYLKPYTRATLKAGQLSATLPYRFSYGNGKLEAGINGASLALRDLVLANGAQTPFKLARLGFSDGALDLSSRHVSVGRLTAEGGQLQLARDRKGRFDILDLLPRFGAAGPKKNGPKNGGPKTAAPAAAAGTPWTAVAKRIELSRFGAAVEDQGSGVKVHVQDLAVKLEGASSDLTQPVKFTASLGLKEGGQLSAQGRVVPASGALAVEVQVKKLALAPLQPLLGKFVKLKIAGGNISAQGRLTAGAGGAKSPRLGYVGAFGIAGLALNEIGGKPFAAWKNLSADKLTASLAPNQLVIPELRVLGPKAKLIIENDHSFNAARLLVRPAGKRASVVPPPTSASVAAASDPFPVRIRRLRFQNAQLEFTDRSLRPQFSAKIYELNGVVTGLSSKRNSRSQIELDGRVDEFGLARIRGTLNPFAPRDNTDVNVVFKNVDMVSATPYAMKFAGYKINEGKISLDLHYRVKNSQLEGENQIVIDHLTLGERVDSPDAWKLPLQLAIAILKDSNGRIDLGLPVSGNMNDPQFSYGAVIWKAIGNVLSKIVTAPFRALGSLFGFSGERLGTIDFDPGSDRLLPPEREKLKQVAQILARRAQLKLSVPGQYSEAADGAALRARALRLAIAKRAGIKLAAGEDPGPLDLGDRSVRGALRGLYAERFGAAALDQQKTAAETAAPAGKLPLLQRAGRLLKGEPQVADVGSFYRTLLLRLEQNQPLAADALTRLGAARAGAIVAALKEAGVAPERALAAAPEKLDAEIGKPVPVSLGLTSN